MWYFSWILGTALAVTIAITSAVWLELRVTDDQKQ
jgi:cyd operon protein YbgT